MLKSHKVNVLAAQDRLRLMGIEKWSMRDSHAACPEQSVPVVATGLDTEATWADLQARVANCQACALSQSRTQTVFGVGNRQADILFIGEAPGFYEDKQGEPFVGRAGQLLNAMLAAIGLARSAVFIANILKCRPPNNRDPSIDEVAKCTHYLREQVKLINPKVIVALGRIAAHYLLETNTPLSRLRGQTLSYGEEKCPVLVTYHPAYLLRNQRDKAKAWQDWQRIASYMVPL